MHCCAKNLQVGESFFHCSAHNVLVAVKQNPRQKYITVTGIGAGDSEGHGGFLYDRIFKPHFLKTIYADQNREKEIIKKSGVDWMSVRPAGTQLWETHKQLSIEVQI